MYDVAIVGAGPAGASAATFTARAKLSTLLLDADQSMTRRAWIPNHLGFPEGISGPDLVDHGKAQATRAGAELVTAKGKELQRQNEGFLLQTEDGQTFEARQVILCLGASVEFARQAGAAIREGTEPRIKEVVATNAEGQTDIPGLWAAGTCAGTSVHTIITAGDGARVAINLISAVKGARWVDHEAMPK
jgi:thioredoxin reductase (NADPH)